MSSENYENLFFYSLTYHTFCLVIREVTYQQTFINIYYTY